MFKRKDYKEKQLRYSIRKVSFGAASVAIVSLYLFMGSSAVSASEVQPVNGEQNTVTNTEEVKKNEKQTEETDIKKGETLDKTSLTKLIEEIDGKFTNGKYTSKTEDSVNQLKAALEAAKTALSTAQTQAELTQAHANLIVATTKLQTKSEDKKEAPVVDTTNGKATVGIKATNTEKASDSNSIANSGSRDERNGKEMDKNKAFRAEAGTVNNDPLALNETPKKLINQYFDEGVEKATGNEKLKLQPATNLTGWKFENPNQDKIIIANGRQTYYGSQMYPDANHTQGIVLGGFTGIRSSNKYDKMGPIYQDIDVVPNSELVLRMRGATFGTQGGPSTYKVEVFDVNNLTTPLGTIEGIRPRPAEFNGLVNIPEGVTKVRIRLSDTNAVQRGIGDSSDPYVEIDGTKVYTGGIVANFSASSGSYIVPKVGRSNYTAVSEASNQATVETTISVNLENKGGAASRNTTYSVQLPEGANIVSDSVKAISASGKETKITPNISNGLLSINAGSVPGEEITKINYTLQLPANKPLSKDLNGVVSYETNNFPILNPSIPRKRGEQRVEPQNVTVTMFKGELEAEVAKSNNLDENNYTPESWKEYQDELVKAKAILNEEADNVSIENRKNQAEINAQLLLVKQARVKLGTEELEKAKNELKELVAVEHLTDGKTPETTTAYNDAVKLAKEAIAKAEEVIQSSDPTAKEVKDALASVNAAKAALANAKAGLVTAATQEQKDKLATDLATLEKAVTDGKTPASVEEYNRKFNELSEELTDAKEAAKSVAEKGENANEIEAFRAQDKVNAIKAKLTEAAALLKDLANKDALTQAKKALEDLKGEETPTGKTTDSLTAYTQAKDAATEELKKAKAVIDDQNATPERVAEALAEVNEKKAALVAAKAALVDKVTPEQKTALGQADADLAVLGETDLAGKTEESKNAYNAEVAKLNAEIEAAKQAAKAIVADADNKTQAEAALAQAKVETLKAKLEAAKAKLVDKADKTALTAAKEALDGQTKEEDPTSGKTTATAEAYKAAKTAAEEAVREAEAIIAKDNATPKEVADALAKVNEKKAALEAAKAALVDKVTPEQKTALGNAETDLAVLGDADLAGKTEESKEAYKAEVAKLNAEIEAAKQAAAAIVADADNKTQAEAALAQAKVETLKAKLEAAKAKLVDKADKTALTAAKEALDGQTKEEDPTSGKTTATAEAYKAAKTAAEEAVREAEAIIAKDNATPKEVADALAKVNEKKAALEAAKAALVDKITQDQKDDLTNAEENLKLADTTGKTKDSIKAYNDEVAKLSDELEAAKQAAKDLVDKGDNAGELEAYRVQAKINKLKSKLAEAAKLLKDIDKSVAKKEVEDAAKKATDVIVANNDLTSEQKAAAKAKVAEEATKAIDAIDKAKSEDDIKAATDAGKLAIEKEAAKAEIEAAKAAKEKAIEANDKLSDAEKQAAKEEAAKAADEAKKAIDAATDNAGVAGAKTTGTAAVEAVNPVGKDKAKAEIEKELAEKTKAIDTNADLTPDQKAEAKVKIAEEAKKAIDAIDKATTTEEVASAKESGKLAIEKEAAKAEIEAAKAAKEKAIEANDKLSDAEKQAAKEEAAKAADEAKKAIDAATDNAGVAGAKTTGTAAVEAVNPVGKDKAKAEIEKELAEKTKAIDTNADLTPDQKAEAKVKIAEEAKKAIDAIDKATTTEEVASAKESGKLAIEKEAAKAEIEAAKAAKEKAIDARTDLTDEEKATAKARVEEEAEAAKNAIDKATDLSDLDKVTETGKDDIKRVTVTSAKEEAKKAIDEALAAKEKAIDARTDLTDEEKAVAKKAAREEAEAAKKAIDKATTLEDINKVLEDEKANIAKINPAGAKEEAKKAIDEALVAKEKAIDARTDLTDEEKAVAKKAAREEAEAAKKAIDKATTLEDINKVLEDEKANIAKINPAGAKEEAKKAIDEALVAKEKAIDARTDLTDEEKAVAKKAAREEAEAAKNAIDKATTSEDINKVLEDGKANIAKINPVGAKEEAKKAIDEALAAKEKAIDARTDLTDEEKAVAKKAAREEAEAAKNAIDKATTSEDINKVLEDGKANIAKINPVGTKEDSKKSIEERLTDKENRQPNNTPVKPQEDAKPAEVSSDNSEQPAVNQTEDVKGNSSTTSQESKASNQKVLPNTGTGNEISIFGSAAMTVLASLGLVATSKKKEEE